MDQRGRPKAKSGLEKVRRYLRKCKLIVVRLSMNISMPCKKCLELIKFYGIRKVYYSKNNELVRIKTNQIDNPYISSKYRNPWNEWECNKASKDKINNKINNKNNK